MTAVHRDLLRRLARRVRNAREREHLSDERRSRASEAHLAAILESSPDAILSTTTEGIVTTWNKGAEDLYGYAADEIIGRSVEVLVPPGLTPISTYRKWALESGHARYAVPRRRKDGRVIEVATTLATVKDPDGNVTGISTIARDITDARKLENQLRQAQKMEAIGRLAGGISHDFNNVLTAIMGNCELLLNDSQTPPDVRQQVGEIQEAAAIGEAIAGKLLQISRSPRMRDEVVDIALVLAEMGSVLRRLLGERIELRVRVPTGPATVRGGAGDLEQVILNLAVNARDAMSDGGVFTIDLHKVEIQPVDALRRLGFAPGPYISVSASDAGSGIDPDILDNIFEPFFSTKGDSASGLGLSTAYQIISQAGGNISVESQPGVGTTFRILMPYVDAKAGALRRL